MPIKEELKILKYQNMINIWEIADPYSWKSFKQNSGKNLRPFLNLYQKDEEGYMEFLDRFESKLGISSPVEVFVRLWYPPVRLRINRFFGSEPFMS